MKKRSLFALLLLLALCVTCWAPTARAAVSGSCGDGLTWSLEEGTLTISGSGAIPDYTGTISPWGQYHTQIRRIVLTEGVTGIGQNAFSGWCGAGIPSESYPILEEIVFPRSLTTIGPSSFAANGGLKSIRIPGTVKEIGEYAFDECFALTEVILESGVERIQGYAFNACSMAGITLPDTLVSIGDQAFSNNPALQTVVIPEGVRQVGLWAFVACPQLTSVTVPGSVTDLGSGTFHHCPALTSIQVSPENSRYLSVDNVLYSKDQTRLHTVGRGVSGEFVIPGTVTTIESYAFEDCTEITALVISDSVTQIQTYAFAGCTGLTKVTWPSSMTTIGDYTFDGCTALKQVVFPDNLQAIGLGAFAKCSSLTSITLPDSITSLGNGAFNSCKSLQTVKLPAGLRALPPHLFRFCSSLTSITLPETVTSIGEYALSSTGLTELELPKNVTSLRQGALADCDSLKVVVFTGNAPGIHKITFDGTTTAVFYPKNNATWTSSVMQSYGGSLTWTAGFPCEEGHSFGNWEQNKAATCTDPGNQVAQCAVCGKVRNQTIPVKEHQYAASVTAPTCTAAGATIHTCEACGHRVESNVQAATGHSYGPWTPITDEANLEQRSCAHCEATEQRTAQVDEPTPEAPVVDESEPQPTVTQPTVTQPTAGQPAASQPESQSAAPSGTDSGSSSLPIILLAGLGGIALGAVVTVLILKKKK